MILWGTPGIQRKSLKASKFPVGQAQFECGFGERRFHIFSFAGLLYAGY
jgi:hypothetical protein